MDVGEDFAEDFRWGGGGGALGLCEGCDIPTRRLTDSFRTGGGGGMSVPVGMSEEWMCGGGGIPDGERGVGIVTGGERGGGGGEKRGGGGSCVVGGVRERGETSWDFRFGGMTGLRGGRSGRACAPTGGTPI